MAQVYEYTRTDFQTFLASDEIQRIDSRDACLQLRDGYLWKARLTYERSLVLTFPEEITHLTESKFKTLIMVVERILPAAIKPLRSDWTPIIKKA